MRHKIIFATAIAAATIAYPFAVYFGIQYLAVSTLSLVLFSLLLLRLLTLGNYKQLPQLIPVVLVGVLCLSAAWFNSEILLRYYPVLMNLLFSIFFALSLFSKQSLIERFVSPFKKDISVHAKRYMRGLTKAWALLLLINAGVALYTACCLSISQWALYNGAIVYLGFAVFTLFEFAYRQYYKSKYDN
jgi:uncharacterized membrane protein